MSLPFPADWKMRETSHYNGGKEWFGYGRQCIQEPRLGAIDRYYRKDRSVVRTWKVDGLDCVDADAAWAALQRPPVFTEEELAALATVGDEPTDHRGSLDHTLAHWLKCKGAIEYGPPGRCKRTDAGRAALTARQPQDPSQ